MIGNHKLAHVKVSAVDIDRVMECVESWIEKDEKACCVPLNLTKYVMAKSDPKLKGVINAADLVIADGAPISYLSRRAGIEGVSRITGIELAERILSRSGKKDWKVFMLGASPENVELAVENVRRSMNYPAIVGFHHGYFKDDEAGGIVDTVNSIGAQVLLLGMGLPQKEYFIADHLDRLNVNFCLPVGGTFDIWAGKKTRSPRIFQALGMEWLYRSLYDPSRAALIARYGLTFLKDFIFLPK